MRRFTQGSDAAFSELEARARSGCVTFKGAELPPGSVPERATIGFEFAGNEAVLWVARGISYAGSSVPIRSWLQTGERRFTTFAELAAWIQTEIAQAFASPTAASSMTVDGLTDLRAATALATSTNRAQARPSPEAIRDALAVRVFGQPEALEYLTGRVSRHLARTQPRRPATVIALGPTGVGKTRTAESLRECLNELLPAEQQHGFLRLNMSEYQEGHRVSQLLGSPPGYIGHGEGAELTDALAANPHTIVLFDEIEKAHPDVFRALMNAMDAGQITTNRARGGERQVDCTKAIFFFTSNLDASEILRDIAEQAKSRRAVEKVCRRRLRTAGIPPELVGRISTFLVYRPITVEARVQIATSAIARVGTEYGLTVERVAPEVVAAVVDGNSDGLGARPDEYRVDEMLSSAFSKAAAANRVRVHVEGPPFVCTPANPKPSESVPSPSTNSQVG